MKSAIFTMAIIVTLALLCQCDKDDPIPSIHIPDINFLNALLELGVDTDGDGSISPDEAEMTTSLDFSKKNISDITGIQAFLNLEDFNCSWNQISRMDITNIAALKELDCRENQ